MTFGHIHKWSVETCCHASVLNNDLGSSTHQTCKLRPPIAMLEDLDVNPCNRAPSASLKHPPPAKEINLEFAKKHIRPSNAAQSPYCIYSWFPHVSANTIATEVPKTGKIKGTPVLKNLNRAPWIARPPPPGWVRGLPRKRRLGPLPGRWAPRGSKPPRCCMGEGGGGPQFHVSGLLHHKWNFRHHPPPPIPFLRGMSKPRGGRPILETPTSVFTRRPGAQFPLGTHKDWDV